LIAYIAAGSRLYVMKPDGSEPARLVVGEGEYYNSDPIWSPDGSVVLFSRLPITSTTGVNSLWAVPYTTEGAMAIEIANSTLVVDPSFSPDGFWIVFKSWVSGSHDIYIMRANGINRELIVSDPAYDYDPAWRP
jgi:TolB protein